MDVPTRALLALGYSATSIEARTIRLPASSSTPEQLAYIGTLLDTLDALDTDILNNIKDSMAVKVQDLGLDYVQYVALANAKGSQILQMLSNATSVTLVFNKYSAGRGQTPKAIRNYF